MTGVRVLVGTRKGAFVLTADGTRRDWEVRGRCSRAGRSTTWRAPRRTPTGSAPPSPAAGSASRSSAPTTAGAAGSRSATSSRYATVPGTHQWYDGTPHPWEFARVWHLEPSADDPDTVLAGRRGRGAVPLDRRRADLDGAARAARARLRPALAARARAGCACTRSCRTRATPTGCWWRSPRPACSAPRTAASPGGPANHGLVSEGIPDPDAEVGHCVHKLASHPSRPDTVFMQKHWDVMRSDDGGEHWHDIGGDLPTDFGFVVDVHAHEPDTVYVLPITSDSEHFPPEGKLRVYRSRTGGDEWEPLTDGPAAAALLRQRAARRDGRRPARRVRRLLRHHRRAGLRLAGRRGQLGADRARPAGRAVGGGADAAMSTRRGGRPVRVKLPTHLRRLAAGRRRGAARRRRRRRRCGAVLDALEARHPVLRGAVRDHGHRSGAGRSCGSSPASRTCRTSPPTPRSRRRWCGGGSRCWSSGPWRGARRGSRVRRSGLPWSVPEPVAGAWSSGRPGGVRR